MNWFTAIVVFVLVWWVLLFAVLPLWTRPNEAPDDLTGWRGAPERPLLKRKLVAATVLAFLVWAAIMAVIRSPYLSFR